MVHRLAHISVYSRVQVAQDYFTDGHFLLLFFEKFVVHLPLVNSLRLFVPNPFDFCFHLLIFHESQQSVQMLRLV